MTEEKQKREVWSIEPSPKFKAEIEAIMKNQKCNRKEAIALWQQSKNQQIEPQTEVIREPTKKENAKLTELKQAYDIKAEADHKHTVEVQARELAKQKNFTSASDKVTDWGAGHIAVDTVVRINPHVDTVYHGEEKEIEHRSIAAEDWEAEVKLRGREKEWWQAQRDYAAKALIQAVLPEEAEFWKKRLAELGDGFNG